MTAPMPPQSPPPTTHLGHAHHHLAQAQQWLGRTDAGTLMDPVRDHIGLALAHFAAELVDLLRGRPIPPAADSPPAPHDVPAPATPQRDIA